MSELVSHTVADHQLTLDPLRGLGLMVCPAPTGVYLGTSSLDGARWDGVVAWLYAQGWEVATDDDESCLAAGEMPDGRVVYALSSDDSDGIDLGDMIATTAELFESVGAVKV